jgi:hypothetical protein
MTAEEATTTFLGLGYGAMAAFPLPPTTVAAWGARAIMDRRGMLDIVPDRTDYWAKSEKAGRKFLAGLDKKLLVKLRKQILTLLPDPSSDVIIKIDVDALHIVASPQRSCGYLYITAWMED